MGAVQVNQRSSKRNLFLNDLSSESRRRRERLHETGKLEGICNLYGAHHFSGRGSETRRREQKRAGNQCRPGRILAAGDGARRHAVHAAHIVTAVHRRRIPRGNTLSLLLMMHRYGAEATGATIHAARKPRSAGQGGVHKRHRQQAKPCGSHSNALLSFSLHEDLKPNNQSSSMITQLDVCEYLWIARRQMRKRPSSNKMIPANHRRTVLPQPS